MPDSVHCPHCGAPFGERDARFCSFCGTERPAPTPSAGRAWAPNAPERFAAAERHPSVPELLKRTPSSTKYTLNGACGVVFLAVFCLFALGMAATFVGAGGLGAHTFGSNAFGVGGGFLALVPLAIAGVGLAGFVHHVRRLARFESAGLERTIVLVVDERVAVSGGDRAHTTYYATLEGQDRQRKEHRIDAKLAGQIAPDDLGMAYVKDDVLLDFQRIDV